MEKRRFSRIALNMDADLMVDGVIHPFSQIENLGVGGCSLRTTIEFQVGAACRFWLPLKAVAQDLGVEVFGEIVRCDGQAIGVRFTKITPESLFHLQNLIRFNAPDPDRIEEEISRRPGLL